MVPVSSDIGSNEAKPRACFSTKAWYAAFLLSRNITIGPVVSQAP
jgi:hypothetical protein